MKNLRLSFLKNHFFKKKRAVLFPFFKRKERKSFLGEKNGRILKSANLSVSLCRFLLNQLQYK